MSEESSVKPKPNKPIAPTEKITPKITMVSDTNVARMLFKKAKKMITVTSNVNPTVR
ncbi:MAG: Uncharacterised protein [Cryomorphaceae bacterium]|nr:MAG: Uncharacterised protein [Cryomorphaceae bacterium]